jgi:hypothetical protein
MPKKKRAQVDEISSDHNPVVKGKKVKLTVYEIQKQGDFKCKKCNEIFFTGRKLQFHKKTHTNTKPFKCDLCGKRLLNPTTLLKHTRIFHKDVVDLPAPRKHVINYDRCENPKCEEMDYKYTSVHVSNTSECREYYEGVYKKSIVEIFDQKRKDKVKARWIKPKGYYKKDEYLDAMSFVKVELGEDEVATEEGDVKIREQDPLDSEVDSQGLVQPHIQ